MKILKKVSVLGTGYRIIEDNCNNDPLLQNSFGYTDYTSKKIVITDFQNEEIEIEDVAKYRKQVIRHELIHAFYVNRDFMKIVSGTMKKWLIG